MMYKVQSCVHQPQVGRFLNRTINSMVATSGHANPFHKFTSLASCQRWKPCKTRDTVKTTRSYSACIRDASDAPEDASPESVLCQRLPARGLVRATGADTTTFLQGLITNDMRCLEGTADCLGMGKQLQVKVQSLYAMMLNVKVR